MTDTRSQDQEPEPTDDDALRKRLLGRVAVAGVIILGLLASLAIFDSLNAPEPAKVAATDPAKAAATATPAPPPAVASPVPPSETAAATPASPGATPTPPAAGAADAPGAPASATQPVASTGGAATPAAPPAGTAAAVPPPAPVAPATVAKATPEQTSSPGAPPLVPLPAEKPLTKPATARQAMIRQSEPALQLPPPMAMRPDPQREIAQAPLGGKRDLPASRPLTQSASQQALSGNRLFALQLGVFNNLANAEELRARLELQGIPSSIEARVQVGPFKTREEVESAREKLRALGMESGIMISLRK